MYEEFRRQKFTCSGLLFWTLSDSCGVHNWSLIDYGLRRKPIYHALKATMAPLALCVQGYDVQTEEGKAHYTAYWADHPEPLKIWGMNDTLNPQQATLSWAMIQTDGIKLAEGSKDCLLPANASALLEQVDAADVAFVPEQTVLRVRWIKEKHILNETKYFFAPFHCMIPQDAKTDVRISRIKAGQYAVTLLSDRFIWKAHLAEPDGDQYDENDFDLWPGEAKTITAVTDREDFVPYLTWIGKEEDA